MSTAALQYQMERLDRIINRRVGEEEAALKRADADLEVARRAKMRQAAEQRREIQAVYADAFAAFGTEVPAPVDDEPVAMYRARLFNRLVRRLPQITNGRAPEPTTFRLAQRWTTSKRW
jgi:hypothetical protein